MMDGSKQAKSPQKNSKKKAGKPRSAQAPGQFYGYSIQTTRMVARLLRCTQGQAVSLEVLDDVAVTGGTTTVVEQTKSGLAHNPVTDRSVDLWKTLFNWIEAIRSGALKNDTKFVLYVAQSYNGAIITKLHGVKRPGDAAPLIEELRDELWGPAPNRVKKAELSESIAKYVNGVLDASNDMLARLFAGLEFVAGSGSPVDELEKLLKEKAIGEEAIEKVLESILGWTKKRVEKLIETNRPPTISWEEFNKQLIAAARKFDRSDFLAPTPVDISESEVEQELRSRQYIQQMRWINCADQQLEKAVTDFLRSSVDRTAWSERGDVLESSFEEFSEQLERHWEHRKQLAEIELPSRSEIVLGQAVLTHCLMAPMRLQGLEVPHYFVPGSYHALADTFKVGWHPRFEEFRRQSRCASAVDEAGSDDKPGRGVS